MLYKHSVLQRYPFECSTGQSKSLFFTHDACVCVCVCESAASVCRAFPNRKLGQKNRQSWSKTYQVADCGMKLLNSDSTRRDKQQ